MLKKRIYSNIRLLFLSAFLAIVVSGCATYGQGVKKSVDNIKKGQYQLAEQEMKKALKPDGDDRLLYYLELGSLKRLSGEYSDSNFKFETAEKIAEDLYTKKAGDVLSSMLLNPRQSAYPGNDFEKIYINYFKALNYIDMAETSQDQSSFEDAVVELRRLDYKLKSYEVEKGNYKEVEDKKKQTFVKLLNIFKKFQGNWVDQDWLKFREDAHARYLAGVIYEMNNDYDNARISYQNAAELYEQGYVKQYSLDEDVAQRAWYDAIRMMIKSGGWSNEWPQMARDKLSEEKRNDLKKLSASSGEVVIIDHIGLAPARKEMNLVLKADANTRSLYLYPILTGSPQEKDDQRAWFFLLYSDKGVMSIINNYSSGGLSGVAKGLSRKTISIGPLWDVADNLGLIGAIGSTGIRVTVPYYSPVRNTIGKTEIIADGKRKYLLKSEDIGRLAIQEQLLNAGNDLNTALARTSMKNIIAYQAGSQLGGLAALGGKIAAAATSACETRNWLTLPEQIRINRISLGPGNHNVKIVTKNKSGVVISQEEKDFNLKPGEVKIWSKRTIVE
jgi:hypothetical protein